MLIEEAVQFTDKLTIRFEGENAIDVNQLVGYINGVNKAYHALVSKQYSKPDVRLEVVAIDKGSFVLALQSIIALAPDLITKVPAAISSFKDFLEIVKIKKELKGKPAQSHEKEGDKEKIVNHEGETHYHDCTVTNIYFNNPIIDEGVSEAFKAMGLIRPRAAIELSSGNETEIVSQQEYLDMARKLIPQPDEEDKKQQSIIDTELRLGKVDFRGDTMWSFVDMNDKNITARIEDQEFLEKLHENEVKLSAQMVLHVRLRIEIELDDMMDIKSKKYFIEEVYSEETPPVQTRMDI